ncbi:hypothetical protein M3Y96_00708800 [Aphelenchoides besseyi]|nr:hypothetical protein M3Y96_00708800 [Aphelenchoides besseyi]
MEDQSRGYSTSTSNVAADDWLVSDSRNLQRKLDEAQSELYELKKSLPFLEQVDPNNRSESFQTLAARCAELMEERDSLLLQTEQTTLEHRTEINQKNQEVESLKRQLTEVSRERDEMFDRCLQLEKQLDEDLSAHYQNQLHSRSELQNSQRQALQTDSLREILSLLQEERIDENEWDEDKLNRLLRQIDENVEKMKRTQHKILRHLRRPIPDLKQKASESRRPFSEANNHTNTHVNDHSVRFRSYLSNLNETPHENSQLARNLARSQQSQIINGCDVVSNRSSQSDTQTPTAFDDAAELQSYRTNLQILVDQLKTTAQFMAYLLKQVGYEDDEQIQRIVSKIAGLNFDVQEANEISQELVNNSRHLNEALEEAVRSFEQTEALRNNRSRNYSELEMLLRQKEDLIATLTAEKNEIWNDNHQLVAQNNELQRRMAELDLDQSSVDEQLRDRMQQINDQEVELENRAQIIEMLKEHLSDLDEKLADYEQVRAEANQLRRQLARLNDRDRNSIPPEPSGSYNSRRMSPTQTKATSTELTQKIEELNDELQYRKQLFADLCSFVPKAKIREDDTLDVKTAKLIQYIGKLLEYVTKSHSMVEEYEKLTKRLEQKINQGAIESGYKL